MFQALTQVTAFPTILFTIPLAVLCVYWILTVVGALELDLDVDVDLDGDVDGDIPDGWIGSLGSFLGIGQAPLVVLLTLFVFTGWSVSLVGVLVTTLLFGTLLSVPVLGGVFAAAVVASFASTRFGARVLAPLFRHTPSVRKHDVVGEECHVTTGRVDASFGQADVYVGGSALRIEVRTDRTPLALGHRALVVEFDEARDAYIVEPLAAAQRISSSQE